MDIIQRIASASSPLCKQYAEVREFHSFAIGKIKPRSIALEWFRNRSDQPWSLATRGVRVAEEFVFVSHFLSLGYKIRPRVEIVKKPGPVTIYVVSLGLRWAIGRTPSRRSS